ncbi:MAG: TetR/AcrR family transcriptional regulator [Chloroflexota bacterium]|nr:TetR/AcrR family transcriptional regulator [Dehalococcoidia bacterium]MDW8252452.1 TetR/AcrR family transcriptional regulator [Chloroflexota bacterium]
MTRRRILEQTARAIRATGIERVGISALMGALGLTHGGFYAHFPSKDALAAEALAAALAEQCDRLLAAGEDGPAAMVDAYLSPAHRDHPEDGCPLPAVAAEVARGSPAVRRAFTAAFANTVARLATRLPGDRAAAREDAALALIAGMCGALLLSRAVDDPRLADRILLAARAAWQRLLDQAAGAPAARADPAEAEKSETPRPQPGERAPLP